MAKYWIDYSESFSSSPLEFSSMDEIEHCIDVLSKKVLPTTNELAHGSWVEGYQHLHWLTKWPGDIKSYKDRMAIAKLLGKLKSLNT